MPHTSQGRACTEGLLGSGRKKKKVFLLNLFFPPADHILRRKSTGQGKDLGFRVSAAMLRAGLRVS